MSGSTIVAPLLTGFDPSVAVLFSGRRYADLLRARRGRVPSYLGSSFSFIAVVIAAQRLFRARAEPGSGRWPWRYRRRRRRIRRHRADRDVVGGWRGSRALLPPVVTGAVVAAIGLNLAPVAVKAVSGSQFDTGLGSIDRSHHRRGRRRGTVAYGDGSCRHPRRAGGYVLSSVREWPSASASRSTSPRSQLRRGSACRVSRHPPSTPTPSS